MSGKNKPVAKLVVKPVYQYISKCCNAPAIKPPCVKVKQDEDPSSLGKWRCTTCRKATKVLRRFPLDNQPQEA